MTSIPIQIEKILVPHLKTPKRVAIAILISTLKFLEKLKIMILIFKNPEGTEIFPDDEEEGKIKKYSESFLPFTLIMLFFF